ncbi:MAG TPA: hypothetical protein VIY48_13360 [Candidatus Paceibacterota bacterium]
MRCYNGCPDKELQAVLDDNALASKELAAIGARATYFPMEEKWMVFKDCEPISKFHDTKRQAANAVLANNKGDK